MYIFPAHPLQIHSHILHIRCCLKRKKGKREGKKCMKVYGQKRMQENFFYKNGGKSIFMRLLKGIFSLDAYAFKA
jgi:hypothetical protein